MIEQEVRGRCLVLTINRPEARNAVDGTVTRGMEEGIDRLESDVDLWVGVLTGVPPVFCAGADLKAVGSGRRRELSTERGGFAGVTRRARVKPLIAAVDGPALAGGTEMVLATDLVVASTSARFGIPEVKRGLVAGAGGLFRLGRRVPANVAMEWALTGDPVSAEEAHRWGLVNTLCEPGEALEQALALAERITANAPLAVQASRRITAEAAFASEEEGWRMTHAATEAIMQTDDVQEGIAAFTEKRAPAWRGR